MTTPRKLYIKTYGCQMNVYDSERMAEALGPSGYTQVDTPEAADMILLNTCHIHEKSAEKVYSELGRFKGLKAANPDLKIGVAGCVAQAEGQEIMRRQPLVDLVVGPQSYHRLPALEARARLGEKPLDTDFPEEDKFDHLPKRPLPDRAPTAFLTVQEGCDKFCAFCVVPYTRGAEVSRPAARILKEAEDLVARGVREITLLGQNVNAYHGAHEGTDWGLARLIREMAKIDGLARIRFTTSHPNDMEDDLIAAHGDCDKLMPYLHLPVQSGSDRILKRMNRKHTAAQYITLIDRIRAARPDLLRGISSSASRRRPKKIFRPPSIWCATSVTGRLIRSNIQRAPAPPPPSVQLSPPRSRTTVCNGFKRCYGPSKSPPKRPWSGAKSRSCSKSRGGCRGK